MQIDRLQVSNFRGISDISISALGTMVVIAGQNGSGKSCIFDAIRLLKSVYGGYQQNEWQQWMGEFQIQLTNNPIDFVSMFNDPCKPIKISCDFRLSEDERTYIHNDSTDLLSEMTWRVLVPESYDWGGSRMARFAEQFRNRESEVLSRVKDLKPKLTSELSLRTIRGEFTIPVGGSPQIVESVALSLIFGIFRPQQLGVIDFHGAQRTYGREYIKGISFNLDLSDRNKSHSALYNYAEKYRNVKSEMASSYIREILTEQAGIPRVDQPTLTNTLKELFLTFFPDKEFLGPQPTADGGLTFPVRTSRGNIHDLDELSAGEKEILYGYLRIRNSTPKHSIILLDEPELHLNPRLIRGLPHFYHKNLGQALGNQIWLVTHSDALLREVVGRDKYNVFHMIPCSGVNSGESQLKSLSATADLELALIDLVGDLAAYRPNAKVVIFEGGGDSDFDQEVTSTLFPEFASHVNLVSGSNKSRVRALHEILERASQRGQLPFKFFAVADNDTDPKSDKIDGLNIFTWNVYHIENYFLETRYIARVLSSLGQKNIPTEEQIGEELRECARETLPELIRHELAEFANDALIRSINTKTDPKTDDLSLALSEAVERSLARITSVCTGTISKKHLEALEQSCREKHEENLASGEWIRTFRGRDILKRFAMKRGNGISYEIFRNLLISQMKDDSFQPAGMKTVVDKIIAA